MTCPIPQTADALKFDLRWKVACGRSLLQLSFDPSTLVYWRKRIATSDRPDRVFDAVAEVIAQTGILAGRRKRCVDSTVFDDAVATQDTVTQLVAAIRKVARVVPGAGAVIAAVCRLDYRKPGKPPIDWDDPAAKQALVSDLVNDALAVLEALTGPGAPERDAAAADALGLLALVAGQDVEPAEESDGTDGRWRIARQGGPGQGDFHRGHPVGCRKSAWPVSCDDPLGSDVRHDDHSCPCACSTSCSSGSAAGWSCSAGHRPPRTRSCSC